MSHTESSSAMRYRSRYPSTSPTVVARVCPVCGGTPPSRRSVYCKTACKQLAYRLRHQRLATVDPVVLGKQLQRQRLLVAHTVYECSSCGERFLGERRCPDCETIILLADLLRQEVTAPSSAAGRSYPQPLDTGHPHNGPRCP